MDGSTTQGLVSMSVSPSSAGLVYTNTSYDITDTLNPIPIKAAATITPGTSNQTIAAGTYLTGAQTIAGDADLIAANIKAGVSIFNVTGTFTSDATATAAKLLDGETAYVNGSKITGELVVQHYYTGSGAPASSLGQNGDIYIQE